MNFPRTLLLRLKGKEGHHDYKLAVNIQIDTKSAHLFSPCNKLQSPYYWNEKTQNCLMSSPRNDPFWIDLFAVLLRNSKKEEVLEW